MRTPQVGDRVRVTVDQPEGSPLRIGDERRVVFVQRIQISVRQGDRIVKVPKIQLKTNDYWYLWAGDHCELLGD